MSDNKAEKNRRSENKRKSTYLWRETGGEEEMSGRKKCSRERCVQPTAATGRIRPTFLLTTLISVRLSTIV